MLLNLDSVLDAVVRVSFSDMLMRNISRYRICSRQSYVGILEYIIMEVGRFQLPWLEWNEREWSE